MSPEPSGEVERTAGGRDLILRRDLPLEPDQAWAWITESGKTGQWFGTWTGAGEAGGEIEVTMVAEECNPKSAMKINACEPGRSYEVTGSDESGGWNLELKLEEGEGGTRLTFIHHLGEEDKVEMIGPGWEFYLDHLLAAIEGNEKKDFSEYWPAMGPYYAELG